MKSFGEILKELRTSKKISQQELSDSINKQFSSSLNKSMISKWESNKSDPSLSYVRFLAKYFNVSANDLLDIDNKDGTKEYVFVSSDEKQLINDYKKLKEYGKKEALKRLNELTRLDEFIKESNEI